MPRAADCPRCAVMRRAGFDGHCAGCGVKSRAAMRSYRGFAVPLRMERRAKMYTSARFGEQKFRAKKSDARIARRVYALHGQLLARFGWALIVKNGLDNPYMTETARRTLINDVLRYRELFLRAGRKKTVQSVKAVHGTRRAA